jgi:glycerol-3-phosphate cytidylyltransferase
MNSKSVLIYGTFDLFHIGHKNILSRAREYADSYDLKLVVGVTAPEFDQKRGKTNVYDSLEVRKGYIKQFCVADEIIVERYVGQKIDDIKKYNAVAIIFGSDWKGKMDYLNEFCEVIYLPRTEGISSTQLREAL